MKNIINSDIENKVWKDVVITDKVMETIYLLQEESTVEMYHGLLDKCISAAIENAELFSDDEALDVIRGLHCLKKDLSALASPGLEALKKRRESEEKNSEKSPADESEERKEKPWEA